MQALKVLVVAWVEQRFDAQQVAALAWHAMVQRQLDAQIGEVVTLRTLLGPESVTAQSGDHHQRQGACQEFSHEASFRRNRAGHTTDC
ncbi:hypothetical protein D3C71_1737610 [compost metagenome]